MSKYTLQIGIEKTVFTCHRNNGTCSFMQSDWASFEKKTRKKKKTNNKKYEHQTM